MIDPCLLVDISSKVVSKAHERGAAKIIVALPPAVDPTTGRKFLEVALKDTQLTGEVYA